MKRKYNFSANELARLLAGILFILTVGLLKPHEAQAAKSTCVLLSDAHNYTNMMLICTSMDIKDFRDIKSESPKEFVTSLDLSHNQLRTICNDTFSVYFNLANLFLSHNEITHIDRETFSSLYRLRDVDLSNNKLEFINPELFSENLNLVAVSLAGNPLVYIQNDAPILKSSSLQHLDLNACGLTSIYPATLSRMPKLTHLYLNNNYLRTISSPALQGMKDLIYLELYSNRWDCNCDLVDTVQWCYEHGVIIKIDEPVMCIIGDYNKVLWTRDEPYSSCRETLKGDANISNEDLNPPELLKETSDVFPSMYTLPEFQDSSELYTVSDIDDDLPNTYSKNRISDDAESSGGVYFNGTDWIYLHLSPGNIIPAEDILPVISDEETLPEIPEYVNKYPVSDDTSTQNSQPSNLYLVPYDESENRVKKPYDGDYDYDGDDDLIFNGDEIPDLSESSGTYKVPDDVLLIDLDLSNMYPYSDGDEVPDFLNFSEGENLTGLLQSSKMYTGTDEDTMSDLLKFSDLDQILEDDFQKSSIDDIVLVGDTEPDISEYSNTNLVSGEYTLSDLLQLSGLDQILEDDADYDFDKSSIDDIVLGGETEPDITESSDTNLVLDEDALLALLQFYDLLSFNNDDEVPALPKTSDEDVGQTPVFSKLSDIFVPNHERAYNFIPNDDTESDLQNSPIDSPIFYGDLLEYPDTYLAPDEGLESSNLPLSSDEIKIPQASSNTHLLPDKNTMTDDDQIVEHYFKRFYVQDDSDLNPIFYTDGTDEEHTVHKKDFSEYMDPMEDGDKWEGFFKAIPSLWPSYKDTSQEVRNKYLSRLFFAMAFVVLVSLVVALALVFKFTFTRSSKYQKVFQGVVNDNFSGTDQRSRDTEPV